MKQDYEHTNLDEGDDSSEKKNIIDSLKNLSDDERKEIENYYADSFFNSIQNEQNDSGYNFQSMYYGPTPPPDFLKEINEIVPGAAKDIINNANKQTTHRIDSEKEAQRQSWMGQIFAFVLSILALVATVVLAMYGHDTVAGIVGGTTIVGLATVFVVGKKLQKNNS